MLKNNSNKCIKFRLVLEHITGDNYDNSLNYGQDNYLEPSQNPGRIKLKIWKQTVEVFGHKHEVKILV